jgi:hypothetical protein
MRTKIAIIGLVLMVVGIALFFGGGELALGHTSAPQTLTLAKGGEWASSDINVSAGSLVIVTSSTPNVYLVSSSNLGKLNDTNVGQYAINSTKTTAAGETTIDFSNLTAGQYLTISTSAARPNISVVNEGLNSLITALLPFILGVVLGFVGFIILIVGLLLKKKLPKDPEQVY